MRDRDTEPRERLPGNRRAPRHSAVSRSRRLRVAVRLAQHIRLLAAASLPRLTMGKIITRRGRIVADEREVRVLLADATLCDAQNDGSILGEPIRCRNRRMSDALR
jgi:hypothetical protein